MSALTKAIALVGCAHIHTQDYLSAIASEPDFAISAVFDRNSKRALEVSKACNAPVVESVGDLLGLAPHGIIVLSETAHHEADIAALAKSGCPLFVEKPLSTSFESAERIAKTISERGIVFHTGFFLRSIPAQLPADILLTTQKEPIQ